MWRGSVGDRVTLRRVPTAQGEAQPHAGDRDGIVLEQARREKENTYPELVASGRFYLQPASNCDAVTEHDNLGGCWRSRGGIAEDIIAIVGSISILSSEDFDDEQFVWITGFSVQLDGATACSSRALSVISRSISLEGAVAALFGLNDFPALMKQTAQGGGFNHLPANSFPQSPFAQRELFFLHVEGVEHSHEQPHLEHCTNDMTTVRRGRLWSLVGWSWRELFEMLVVSSAEERKLRVARSFHEWPGSAALVVESIAPAPAVLAALAPLGERQRTSACRVRSSSASRGVHRNSAGRPAPVVEYIALAPAVHVAIATVVARTAVAPAVSAAAPPGVEYIAIAPAVHVAIATVVARTVVAPAVSAAASPGVEYIATAPAALHQLWSTSHLRRPYTLLLRQWWRAPHKRQP